MADITVTVSSPSDSVNITVPSSDSALNIIVKEYAPISVDISPNVAYQGLTNLLDVQGTPTDSQMIIWDDDQGAFVFIDLGVSGGGGFITNDITVTNTDGAFSHILGYTYSVADSVALESIIRQILDPTPLATITFSNTSPTSIGTYEVGSTSRNISSIAFSVSSVSSFDDNGVLLYVNNANAGFDAIVPTSTANTVYAIQSGGVDDSYDVSSAVYKDYSFSIRGTDEGSVNGAPVASGTKTIKIRPRHIFYGSTTELTSSSTQGDIQSLYDALVTTTSSPLGSEQLKDNSSSYIYDNSGNKYNLFTDDAYTYYFYPSSLGALSDIKLGGSTGPDIDTAFINVTESGPVSLSNGEVSTDYYVYRSSNRKAFTADQSIYFAN